MKQFTILSNSQKVIAFLAADIIFASIAMGVLKCPLFVVLGVIEIAVLMLLKSLVEMSEYVLSFYFFKIEDDEERAERKTWFVTSQAIIYFVLIAFLVFGIAQFCILS